MRFQPKALPSQCMNLIPFCLLMAGLLGGCAWRDGRVIAAHMAEANAFQPLTLSTDPFILKAWLKPGTGPVLYVYIEGDGFAWRSRHEPSSDPTPHTPKGFALALSTPTSAPVAYLGRPCQYVEGEERRMCEQKYWTSHRFNESVIASMDQAVDQLKVRSGAKEVSLCGYSGGGAIAALLAERRTDVRSFATVAGNLAVKQWTDHHKISPLTGSLDPMTRRSATAHIPQIHLVGGSDWVVPPFLAQNWCASLPNCQVIEIPHMAHGDSWESIWPELWERAEKLGTRLRSREGGAE